MSLRLDSLEQLAPLGFHRSLHNLALTIRAVDFPRQAFGRVGNLALIVLLQPRLSVGGGTDIAPLRRREVLEQARVFHCAGNGLPPMARLRRCPPPLRQRLRRAPSFARYRRSAERRMVETKGVEPSTS